MVTSSNNYVSVEIIPPISYVGLLWRLAWCEIQNEFQFYPSARGARGARGAGDIGIAA